MLLWSARVLSRLAWFPPQVDDRPPVADISRMNCARLLGCWGHQTDWVLGCDLARSRALNSLNGVNLRSQEIA